MYETSQIISWLRDKAARTDDPSWQRMMVIAADRLEELSRAQRWFSTSENLPPTKHEVYDDIDGPIEWDNSDPVLAVTTSGDLVCARFVLEDGKQYWFDVNNGEECSVDRWQPDPREFTTELIGGMA